MIYYRVANKMRNVPRDYHSYGYETSYQFEDALQRILDKWAGKTGKSLNARHGCRLLIFKNKYEAEERAWIPSFMLEQVPAPMTENNSQRDTEEELDRIFGID